MAKDADRERKDRGGDRREGGEGGSQFLDLEISKVLASDASRLARRALQDLVLERIKEQLVEMLGDRLDAMASFAAEDLMMDIETNLEIERHILTRRVLRDTQEMRLRSILAGDMEPDDEEDDEEEETPF